MSTRSPSGPQVDADRLAAADRFVEAFDRFSLICRQSINPDLSVKAVEEMLVQHLLTERIFRTVFNNSDFTHRNVVAREIERIAKVAFTGETGTHFGKEIDHLHAHAGSFRATVDGGTQAALLGLQHSTRYLSTHTPAC